MTEWLETNGLGGYASSTTAGLNTRRYHGLLVAALPPPLGRTVLVSKLEETLVTAEGQRFDLSCNQYEGAVYPRGDRYLTGFRRDPFPAWTYCAGGVQVVKRLFLAQGENSVVVEYEIDDPDCRLELRPLIAFRDYHATTHANPALNGDVRIECGVASIRPYSALPRLYFAHNAAELVHESNWYYRFEYARERERGLESGEDLYHPFTLRFEGKRAVVIASTKEYRAEDAESLRPVAAPAPATVTAGNALVRALTAAAGQFVIQRGWLNSVIAGYHWFGEWGRDTMISLTGLTLVTGRPGVAKNILLAYAGLVSEGMLPNRFPDGGTTPEYNTVDATLWFFEAVRAYLRYTGDAELVGERLYPVLRDILDWHIRATRYGIRADEDGLLSAGAPGVQLTWMDTPATPRRGKPVEIQALWYNALRIVETLAGRFGDRDCRQTAGELADRAAASFNAQFWNEPGRCLFDGIDDGKRDPSLRPNQIFAVSLPHSMLSPERARLVVDAVERELRTPFGLRTLSPKDARYRGRYEGGVAERDAAYHQGTVWPWLMGPFLTAHVKTYGRSDAARQWLKGFEPLLSAACLGQLPEILDGDAPHTPRGCVAQAWSVAEVLRAAVEDVLTP